MLNSVQKVLDVARGELGYYAPADPEPGSKYGRWLAETTGENWLAGPSTTVWWCCCFVSWVLAQAGVECRGFPSYNTDLVLANALPSTFVPVDSMDAGDVVIFDWDGNLATDHVGIVENFDGYELTTIEGNYRNSVARVNRTASMGCIARVIRPPYEECSHDHLEHPLADIAVDGWWGRDTTRLLQRRLGCVEDGEIWHQHPATCSVVEHTLGWCYDRSMEGSPVIRALQARLGVEADGLMGPDSRGALIKATCAASYGDAVATLQLKLNG